MSIFSHTHKGEAETKPKIDQAKVKCDLIDLLVTIPMELQIHAPELCHAFCRRTGTDEKTMLLSFLEENENGHPYLQSLQKTLGEKNVQRGVLAKGIFTVSRSYIWGRSYIEQDLISEILNVLSLIHDGDEEKRKTFCEKFKPHADRYLPYVLESDYFRRGFNSLARFYACFAEVSDEYKAWQDDGLSRFIDLYVENYLLIEALKDRYHILNSKKWLSSLTQDFDWSNQIIKNALEYCTVVENLLAQAFEVDIAKHRVVNDLGALGMYSRTKDLISYDWNFLHSDLGTILSTIIHEFGHKLQYNEWNKLDKLKNFFDLNPYDQTVFFFNNALFTPFDNSRVLYYNTVMERDARDFVNRAGDLLINRRLKHDVDLALVGISL